MRFPIVIHKDADSRYGVTVPDLPGCFSAGDTLDEAFESARDAIACHTEGLLKDGEPIPAGTSLESHQTNGDYRSGIWAIVSVDVLKLSSRTTRINITLPERVLAIVNQAAAREGQSRSELLARAAVSYIQRRSESDPPGLPTGGHASGPSDQAGSPRTDPGPASGGRARLRLLR